MVDVGRPVHLRRCSSFTPSTLEEPVRIFDRLECAILQNMNTKPTSSGFETRSEAMSDAEMERLLELNHEEIEAKLQVARESIARGEEASLEPLEVVLRSARRHARATR